MTNSINPIVIIGGNGKTGHRVNNRLLAKGLVTRLSSRSSSTPFDWQHRDTWPAALQGVKQAYVVYQPDLAVPRAEADIAHLTEVAKACGVEHLVLLSGRGEQGAENAEQILQASGLQWNIVRASWFAQNFSESFMLEGIQSGTLFLPAGNIPEPFIDIDDIADVVVACLTDQQQRNKLFEVSGPRALTFADAVATISKAAGRPISYQQIPIDDFLHVLEANGEPEELLWLMRELFTVVFDGRNTVPSHGVEEALGRPATDFNTYVQKNLATGVWSQATAKQA